MLEFQYYVPSNFPKIFVLVCTLEFLSVQNPPISGTILKKRNSRRSSKPFPSRVKTPAAYVRVRCYPPARVSNFVKDFLAGAYHWTSKESARFWFLLEGRRDDYGKAVVYVLGFWLVWAAYQHH